MSQRGFAAIVCEMCGDVAHPDWSHRRMIGRVGNLLIHDDCCAEIHATLYELGEGSNPLIERFKIHRPHWPSTE